jgi:hypothetical protein
MFAVSIAFITVFALLTSALGDVLMKEVMTREFTIHVGKTGQNEIKEVISREASLWINYIGDAAFEQIFSREMSFVVVSDAPPAPITELTVNPSPTGEIVTLDWNNYNQWVEKDISHFDIYYTPKGPFETVLELDLTQISVPAESTSITIGNLPAFTDHYFAIVPVDALGNYISNVTYSTGYVLSPEVTSREISFFVANGQSGPQEEAISREISMVVTSDVPPSPITDFTVNLSPTGEIVTLDWNNYNQWAEKDISHFDIYYTAKGPFESVPETSLTQISVPAESTSVIIENLPAFTDHYFAIIPVDALGNYIPNVNYSAGYVLSPEVISREISFFIGEDDYPQKQVISREITVLKPDSKVPEPVTGIDSGFFVKTSNKEYSAVDMDWNSYNEYAQNDVVQYNIYYNTKYFKSIEGLTPFKSVPAETREFTLDGLPCDAVLHFVVVAEDSLGNFDSTVHSFSWKTSICYLGEVKNLSAESDKNSLTYTWEPPYEAESFLSHYHVYFAGSSTAVKVEGDLKSWTATELLDATGYNFEIKTVDKFGTESDGTSILSATYLPNPTDIRITGVGSNTILVWNSVEPESLVYYYAIYKSQNPITNVSGLSPIATRKGTSISLGTIDQYFTVATVNVSGGQDPKVVSVFATKQAQNGDVNNNGKIDLQDVIMTLKHLYQQ